MNECICSSCKNLKCNILGEGDDLNFVCQFGFPSEECGICEDSECEKAINCSNYEADSDEGELVIVNCKKCGKELKKAFDDNTEGEIMCVDCYLENN